MFFTDYYNIPPDELDKFGALNINLDQDMQFFIDPFLLYASKNTKFNSLHKSIIRYLSFLRDISPKRIDNGSFQQYFCFKEIPQNHLGFSENGFTGSGLGVSFAKDLRTSLEKIVPDFGRELYSESSHLEKLALLNKGIGADRISDFATNLIKGYLLEYTQKFSIEHLKPEMTRCFNVSKAYFDYDKEVWLDREFILPVYKNDYVLLTPKSILTKNDTWISRKNFSKFDFFTIIKSLENEEMRSRLNILYSSELEKLGKSPSASEKRNLNLDFALRNTQLFDSYIKLRESEKQSAMKESFCAVSNDERFYFNFAHSLFFQQFPSFLPHFQKTYDEARYFIDHFKDYIENMGGHLIFNPINARKPSDEKMVQNVFGMLLSSSAASQYCREVNNGRGPVDFVLTRGRNDTTLIELKLASNTQLKRNLKNQLDIYKRSLRSNSGYAAIIAYSDKDLARVDRILSELGLIGNRNIVIIDSRNDNKPTGSKA